MVTPARRQYLAIKEQHPDALLLYQIGDFYETFDEDARTLARDLEVTLTSKEFGRDGRVPLAGIPVRALDAYLRKLVAKGHRVAICDQVSEPGHGLVERAVTRIVTPGTIAEPQLLPARENSYLAALLRHGDEAALAYADVSTGEFAVTTFAGPDPTTRLAAELQRLAPTEVLLPADAAPYQGPGHPTLRERATFEPEQATALLLAHFRVHSLEGFGCAEHPLARGAAGAIVAYLRDTSPALLAGLTSLRHYHAGDFMTLDGQTRRNLELLKSGRGDRQGRGLLGVLDRSRTAMGGRLLRRWLGQPLLDLDALHARHDAVAELAACHDCRATCRERLGRMSDLERLTGRILTGHAEPRELRALRATLVLLPALADTLAGGQSTLLARLRDALDPCDEVAEPIARAVAEPHAGQRIKPGYDAELDALVDGSREARRWIADLERTERDRTGVKSLKVGYNKVFGYYLEVTRPNLSRVPAEYLRKQTLAACERFITPELKEFEARIADAEQRIAAREAELYAALLRELAVRAPRLLSVASALAQLDVLAAFAEVAHHQGYVRPQLDAGNELHIRAGRHPTVEAALERHAFIANDTELTDEGNLLLLTGPNMAGKSTYLRQVALIVLLAQIGAFVPAQEARIGLVDRIFTRVGAQDDLAAGQSTFMVEMLETAAILHQATARSLLVLDEIGRGTSTYDGLAIARAVVEELHDRIGARTLFATHYHELLALLDTLPRLRAANVTVREDDDGIVFLYRIAPGGANRSYGIHVARLAGLPRSVTDRAAAHLRDLERGPAAPTGTPLEANGAAAVVVEERGDVTDVLAEIAALDLVNTTPLEALNRLFALQRRLRGFHDLPLLAVAPHRAARNRSDQDGAAASWR